MSKHYLLQMDYVSDCCGVPPRGNGDCDTSDIGICPECGDHCEYVDMTEDEAPELTDDQKQAYYHQRDMIRLLNEQNENE